MLVSTDSSSHAGYVMSVASSTGNQNEVVNPLDFVDGFQRRHIGPSDDDVAEMLATLGFDSLDALSDATIPADIRSDSPLDIPAARGEHEFLSGLKTIAGKNKVYRSCIGMGYTGTVTPPVILRNVLENPGWYTQYTPYQAEISQGRLEALLNFQTMIADLTGLPLAGASLLDEATAAAEAMTMCLSISNNKKKGFYACQDCHPQTLGLLRTRAAVLGIELQIGPIDQVDFEYGDGGLCGILVQYPTTDGRIADYRALAAQAKANNCTTVVAADLLALTLLESPGQWGADVCVGSAQRFGVPMGLGGPHAAFIATHEQHARKLPGRIIGVSKDAHGNRALRMAIQTREQHIRRDKATSNICTAQALLAIINSMYAVYHGPVGLQQIARRTQAFTCALAKGLERLGHQRTAEGAIFDTIRIRLGKGRSHAARQVADAARERQINLREYADGTLGVTLDETSDRALVADLLAAFNFGHYTGFDIEELLEEAESDGMLELGQLTRTSSFMTHEVFNSHHSETEMLRYIFQLMSRDLSLAQTMIPLGSCTMKLNATSEMIPVTWPEFANMHPFAPDIQWRGYTHLFRELEAWLGEITGFPAVSLQPNAGSQGEYAGLMVIRAYHEQQARAEGRKNQRNVCLIPASAHGTNPASAVMAGMKVVAIKCDDRGDIDIADLRQKASQHSDVLSALMITYPSTHGVFETTIREVCDVVHDHGGQVYMDGANMNAQVGLTSPAKCGADVCHLNLHKTFCIPHDEEFKDEWLARTCELVDRYRPDLVWFDFGIGNKQVKKAKENPFAPHLQQFAAYYYNQASRQNRPTPIINYKWIAFPEKTAVLDLERSKLDKKRELFWQTDTSVATNSWGYTAKQNYKPVNRIVDDFVDIVSKNGCLLLNVGPRSDGTIPEKEQEMLQEIGRWLSINGEAIYGSRPFKTFGEGPTGTVTGHLSENKNKPYVAEDFRFTTNNDSVYAFILQKPESGVVKIKSFGKTTGLLDKPVEKISLLGSDVSLDWNQQDGFLQVELPAKDPCKYALVLKID